MTTVLVIDSDGTTRHLVDPVSERIAAAIGPKISTQRSSHVETWRDLSTKARIWLLEHRELIATIDDELIEINSGFNFTNHFFADMLPVKGPVLGPFARYEDAISAEIAYLQVKDLPCPLETTVSSCGS